MIAQETFIVGGKEYTCFQMNAFEGNNLQITITKRLAPVLTAVALSGKAIGDMKVQDAARVIAENIDAAIMTEIIFPLFQESKVYSVENKRFIKNPSDMNQCFTMDTLFDFYELVFLVGKYNLGPFLLRLLSQYGIHLGAEAK